MTEFKASNDRIVTRSTDEAGHVSIMFGAHGREGKFTMTTPEHEALREFFQHERDEELGRWRPDFPSDYFAVPQADGSVIVIDERSGVSEMLYRLGDPRSPLLASAGGAATAHAYFDAHPERKPWEDATYKDVWVWTTADNTQEALGWVAGDGTWDIITPKGDGIKAAEDPMAALFHAGFEKFSGTVRGVRRTPEDAS